MSQRLTHQTQPKTALLLPLVFLRYQKHKFSVPLDACAISRLTRGTAYPKARRNCRTHYVYSAPWTNLPLKHFLCNEVYNNLLVLPLSNSVVLNTTKQNIAAQTIAASRQGYILSAVHSAFCCDYAATWPTNRAPFENPPYFLRISHETNTKLLIIAVLFQILK